MCGEDVASVVYRAVMLSVSIEGVRANGRIDGWSLLRFCDDAVSYSGLRYAGRVALDITLEGDGRLLVLVLQIEICGGQRSIMYEKETSGRQMWTVTTNGIHKSSRFASVTEETHSMLPMRVPMHPIHRTQS